MGNVTYLTVEIPLCQDNTGLPISKIYCVNVMVKELQDGRAFTARKNICNFSGVDEYVSAL